MIEQLKAQIKVVAESRGLAQEASERKAEAYQKWLDDHSQLLANESEARNHCQEAEVTLRELTLQAYAETGDKTPAPGVGIRERTVLTYDGKVAFDWAKAHKMALQLDKRAFEKIAKADTPDFVKVSTEAQATIATNLDDKIKG